MKELVYLAIGFMAGCGYMRSRYKNIELSAEIAAMRKAAETKPATA